MNNRSLIIIVTYNSAEYIGDCLLSLNIHELPAATQVLLVDNASTDQTISIARTIAPDAIILQQSSNLGFAQGNNIGIEYAIAHNFDYVYLLNHDTEVKAGFLTNAVTVMGSDQAIAAVQSKLLLFDDKTKINSSGNCLHYLGYGYSKENGLQDYQMNVVDIAYPSGAGVLLRISALKHVGMFRSEFFMYHEDLDLGWRLRIAGYRVMIAPESIVYHKYHFSRNKDKWYYMERNRYLTLLYNYRLPTLILIKPIFLLIEIGSLLFSIGDGWGWQKMRAMAYVLNPKRWGAIARERKKIRRLRKVSDGGVIRLFVSTIDSIEVKSFLLQNIANPLMRMYGAILRAIVWW